MATKQEGTMVKKAIKEIHPVITALTNGSNERDIPRMIFIDDVAKFLAKHNFKIEISFQYLNELLQKYRFMEMHMQKNKAKLREKLPEITQTLNMIIFLQKKASGDGEDDDEDDDEDTGKSPGEFTANFPLADSVYGKATIKPTGTVNLWLGANVMLEYTYEEAKVLLTKNLNHAKERLQEVQSDLLFLRDQITTSEVNVARMFNHDVMLRKKDKSTPAP